MGQRRRRSSWIGYGSAAHSGSTWEKSVAQSATGPVTTSAIVPITSSSRVSRKSSVNRSSAVISPPPQGLLHPLFRPAYPPPPPLPPPFPSPRPPTPPPPPPL